MDIQKIVEELTLEEKAAICSGSDVWHTQGIERLGIPAVMVTDGPCGIRKQKGSCDHTDLNNSVEAVCFPAPCAAACSFDREMLRELGRTIGSECQAEDVAMILGPAVNIKRTPLCGRNFEYYSEDPYLSGELAAAFIDGVQSQDVGTCIKHFAANNQETARMSVSADVDERTLREIYLPAFETAVKEAKPWSLMCSYNRLNGTYMTENKLMLSHLLRGEWGFDGFIMTDWGGIHNRVKSLDAGLDLEMPGSNGSNDPYIIKAVQDGTITEDQLNDCVSRILTAVFRYTENRTDAPFDKEAAHEKARRMAGECIVLLKNEKAYTPNGIRPVLPLMPSEKVAFIGGFAASPRFEGGGSSHVAPYRVPSVLELAAFYGNIVYSEGFPADEDRADEELMEQAMETARGADKIVVFAGLPDVMESESYDRTHMRLPGCQDLMITRLSELNKPIVVVLSNGSPVEMPWAPVASGILECYLCGEASADAQMDILYGRANPSGKLAETFPHRLRDNPSYINYPGNSLNVVYGEGVFVGYRYYDIKETDVLFPFGYGLSYTKYSYSDLRVVKADPTGRTGVTVSVNVTNTGRMAGREIVQLYVSDRTGSVMRPIQELKGFGSIYLAPGETGTVTMQLDERSFSWYNAKHGFWYAADGEYEIRIGSSSRQIELTERIELSGARPLVPVICRDVLIGDLLAYGPTREYMLSLVKQAGFGAPDVDLENADEMTQNVVKNLPLECLKSYTSMNDDDIEALVTRLTAIVEAEESLS